MVNILAVCPVTDVFSTDLQAMLTAHNYVLHTASSCNSALAYCQSGAVDLILLDNDLPNNLGFCQELYKSVGDHAIPIIFMGDGQQSAEIAQALNAGGDDYIRKPIAGVELLARIGAVLRRTSHYDDYVNFASLKLHRQKAELWVDEQIIMLTSLEHRLLFMLMTHPTTPISTDMLLQYVWDYPPGTGNPNIVQVHIANLRHKLQATVPHIYITNIRRQGYQLITH